MKDKTYFQATRILVRLLIILGLIGMPSVGWGQDVQETNEFTTSSKWVLIYRFGHDVYVTDGEQEQLLLGEVQLSPQFIMSLTQTSEKHQRLPISPGYILESILPAPNDERILYVERVDLEADFNLWLSYPDGQRDLLISQKYENGAPTIGYMVPVAWTQDDELIIHEKLMQSVVATWSFSLKDRKLAKINSRVDSFPSPDFKQSAILQNRSVLLLNTQVIAQANLQVSSAQDDSHLEIIGWIESVQLLDFKQALHRSLDKIDADAFLYWPLPNGYRTITCGYGCYKYSDGSPHDGIDIATTSAKPEVRAAAHGWVEKRISDKPDDKERNTADGYGNLVKIRHDNGYYTLYAHLKPGSIQVQVGQEVNAGTLLGNASNAGNTCGQDPANYGCSGFPGSFYHLHFGVWTCATSNCSLNPYSPYLWIGNPPSIPGGSAPPPTDTPRPNRSPNIPSLRAPGDWSVSRDGLSPTLCWNNNGDPDGDRVEFYAEVFESARGANSGWTSSTCWRPNALDGGYFNYQWRVKARDGRGGESGWSETRHFTIEPENRRPEISFNTANGNTASEINASEQNWTFTGTASDPEGKLNRVEFKCEGDSCITTQNIGNNGSWSFQRTGLTGLNRIRFTACDDRQCVDSRTVTLRIDLAPPTSSADANGQTNPSEWFRGTVDVKLRAQDQATGNASVGVGEIRYRVDGGGWQSHGGDNKTVTVNGDGQHTIEYYAIDKVGNEETSRKTISFKIDGTKPSVPGSATETHGVVSEQWQKSVNIPEFVWGASTDATSGLHSYELYFDTNKDSVDELSVPPLPATADRRWIPKPNGVRTDTYYFRARSRDNAGNYSDWTPLFTFRFDNTPPPNPTSASHAAKLISESWQRTTSSANFTWTVPSDEGSGVKGYYIYWGDQQNGTVTIPGSLVTGASYQSAGALCPVGQVCTGYLRIRTVDNVDNLAGDWSTLFTVRYDGAAPTLNFSFNGGVTQTAQTLVTLNLDAHDEPGSGVRDVRSFASSTWSAWEPYQSERSETIPAIGRQEWPVYVQVRDAVGWESTVVSKSVYFEVNRPQPKSANYWLFAGIFNAGNGSHISTNYKLKSSVGQSLDSEPLLSASYIISGGYQAASMAIPLQVPGHDEFNHISGVFASGIVNDTTASSNYRMLSSIGQMGLPDNAAKGTIVSSNYQLRPGFLAALPSVIASPTPPPSPTPGPTPTPEPPKGCEFATLTINNGALFTNNPNVSLNLCAPAAQEMIVSNDGSFSGATWEPFKTSKAWTLTTLGQNVVARLVQARFKDEAGNSYHYAVDDIIYDPTAPSGDIAINDPIPVRLLMQMNAVNTAQDMQIQASAAMESFKMGSATYLNRLGERRFDEPVQLLSPAAAGALNVYLIAQDDNSGLQEMQIGEQANLGNAAWQPYDGLIAWTPSSGDGEKQLYARFRDSAGNASTFYSSTVVIDSHPPLGGINILEDIIGANTVNMHLYLGAEDNLSGVSAIRISHNPSFADAPWQPFAAEITWPIQISATENEKTIYAQFRDAAGNVSQTYSDITIIDRQPPLVYAEVEVSDAQERQIDLYAYDELSALSTVRLSNDPLMSQGVVTMPYSDTVRWTFDDRRVVWIQAEDAVGNRSEGYPSYAPLLTDPTPSDKRVYLPLINR